MIDPSTLSDEEAKEYLVFLRQAVEQKQGWPIVYYTPFPGKEGWAGQKDFLYSPARIRAVLSGNQWGKTTTGICEDISHSLGFRPWLTEEHPHYWVRNGIGEKIDIPNTGIIAGQSFRTAIAENIYPTFEEWCPPELIKKTNRNQQGVIDRIEFTNGSRIRIMSYDQDPSDYEGTRYHWVHFDEPPKRAIYTATMRGLMRHHGRVWFTMTPIREPWIWEDIVSKEEEDPTIQVFRSPSRLNPYITDEEREFYFSKIGDPDERRAREMGEFLHLQGRVYPEFQKRFPWWVESFQPKNSWVRVMSIDPHPRKPIACLWVAISPTTDRWYVYRELYDPSLKTIEQVSNAIHDLERGEEVVWREIDPSAQENEIGVGASIREQFEYHGIYTELGMRHEKLGGIEMIREMLRLDDYHEDEDKLPELIVMDSCPRLCHEFMSNVWADWSIQKNRDERDPKPEVRKRDDDMLDNLRYLRQRGRYAEDFDPSRAGDRDTRRHSDSVGVLLAPRATGTTGY